MSDRYPLCVMKGGDRNSERFRIVNTKDEEDQAEKDGFEAVGDASRKKGGKAKGGEGT